LDLKGKARKVFKKGRAETGISERQLNISLKVAHGIAGIVVLAFEAKTEKRLLLAKQVQGVCELNLAA